MTGTDKTSDKDDPTTRDVDPGVPEDGAEVPPNAPVMVDPQLKDDAEVPPEGAEVPDYAPVMTDPQLKDTEVERDVDEGVPEEGAEVPDYAPVMTDPQLKNEDDAAEETGPLVLGDETRLRDKPAGPVDPQPAETPDMETVASQEADTTTAPAPARPPQKSGGVFPLLLGGALAAALGFAAAFFYFEGELAPGGTASADLEAALAAQAERIDTLEAGLAEAGSGGADQALTEEIAVIREDTSTQVQGAVSAVSALDERLAELDARLAELEARPVTGEGGGPTNLGPISADIASLREDFGAMDSRLAELETQVGELDARVSDQEEGTIAAADAAVADAALIRIRTAIATGEPFDAALADLSSRLDAPELAVLEPHAETGVASEQELERDFAPAARAALAASRARDDAAGLGAFVQSRLNLRSVEPREGDDPDAVLSRIGAAVQEGRVADAVNEADALPEDARAAMSDWISAARARADAVAAADALDVTQIAN